MNPVVFRARWQMGQLFPERVPAAADALLLGGADSPTLAKATPLTDRVFTELGIPPVDPERAWRIVAREIASEAIAGTITCTQAAASLAGLWSDSGWPRGLEAFAGLSDGCDDGPEAREQLAAEILDACVWVLAEVQLP